MDVLRRWTLRVCSECDKPLHGPGGCAGRHERAASAVAVEVAPADDLAGAVKRAAMAELALRQIAELLGEGDDPQELLRVAADVALVLTPWRGQ